MEQRRVIKRPYKRKRKLNIFRVVNAILVLWFIISIILIIFLSNKSYSYKETTIKEIPVSQGETLWDIAKREKYNNEYYKDYDIREIVSQIQNLNNLKNPDIYCNQVLKIIEL